MTLKRRAFLLFSWMMPASPLVARRALPNAGLKRPIDLLDRFRSQALRATLQLGYCAGATVGLSADLKRGDYGWSEAFERVKQLRLRCEAAERERDEWRRAASTLGRVPTSRIEPYYDLRHHATVHVEHWANETIPAPSTAPAESRPRHSPPA